MSTSTGLAPEAGDTATTATMPAPRRPPWWARPWVGPLALLVLGFLAFVLPPYVTLDPEQALVPLNGSPLHYPMLVAHICLGAVSLATLVLQLWPALRRRRPALHRWSGRAYVLSTLPSAALAVVLSVAAVSPNAGNTVGGLLWFVTTLAGWRAARGRRWSSHRRWMVLSVAVGLGIVWGRVLGVGLGLAGVTDPAVWAVVLAAAPTFGWLVNVIAAGLWLLRTEHGRRPRATAISTPGRI